MRNLAFASGPCGVPQCPLNVEAQQTPEAVRSGPRARVQSPENAGEPLSQKSSVATPAAASAPFARNDAGKRLWLWKNFVDGRPEYWAFDNPYPCHPNGDPITLGEPCGYAIFKESAQGRFDVSEDQVIAAIKRASLRSETAPPEGEKP